MANTATNAKSAAKDAAESAKKVANKIENGEVAEGARTMIFRAANTTKERVDGLYNRVEKANDGLEKTLNRVVTGYVTVLSEVAELTHENTVRTLEAVEKVSQAKSVQEAMQIQMDTTRENVRAIYQRLQAAMNTTRETLSEGAETIRENVAELVPSKSDVKAA